MDDIVILAKNESEAIETQKVLQVSSDYGLEINFDKYIQKTTFGNPRFLITDRGTTFTSEEFHTYGWEQKITLHHITTGLPRANGQVERINRTIIPVLSKMSEDDPTKWFKHVPPLQEVLNSTFQRSINTTPFELFFGTQINNKTDLRIQQLIDEQLQLEFNENRELLRKKWQKTQILKVQNENKKVL
ncbi:transposon Tf2-11 polyprotein [Trichonephila clavipes]|nr:transposon Tf2-11 polyprotein [Trichonephila clavipes]